MYVYMYSKTYIYILFPYMLVVPPDVKNMVAAPFVQIAFKIS